MWALVSVSVLVLTCAVDVAWLGPREGEVPVPVGGIELPRHRVMVVLGVEPATLKPFLQVIGMCLGDPLPTIRQAEPWEEAGPGGGLEALVCGGAGKEQRRGRAQEPNAHQTLCASLHMRGLSQCWGDTQGVHTVTTHQHMCTQRISGPQPLPFHLAPSLPFKLSA